MAKNKIEAKEPMNDRCLIAAGIHRVIDDQNVDARLTGGGLHLIIHRTAATDLSVMLTLITLFTATEK